MTKHYCDRCGDETTDEKVSVMVAIDGLPPGMKKQTDPRGFYQVATDTFKADVQLELCSQCRGELHEWQKPVRKLAHAG